MAIAFIEMLICFFLSTSRYIEPESYYRQERSKQFQRVLGGPWKPNNPPKEPCGSGSVVGLIGGAFPHEPDYRVPMPGDGPVLPEGAIAFFFFLKR